MTIGRSETSSYDSASEVSEGDSFDELRTNKRPYGICLVEVEEGLQKLFLDLVPTIDAFIFSSPGSLPEEKVQCQKFLAELESFYAERKVEMKRLIVIGFGFGGMLIKKALVMASQTPAYQELAIAISHLIFILTPHQFDQSLMDFEQIIREMMADATVISESSLQRMATYFTSISTSFRSIGGRYEIINLLSTSQDPQSNTWRLDENLGTNVWLENRLIADALMTNINDLTSIHSCLAPLALLDSDTLFEVTHYIKCLERLSWSWRPTTESTAWNNEVLAESEMKEKITVKLKLHERERGKYPASVCLIGPPGFGKTTFLRGLSYEVEGYKTILPVIFEKRDFQATEPSTVDILKSFIHQILSQVPATFSFIDRFYEFLKGQDVWTEQLLWSTVRKLLQNTWSHKLVLLINGTCGWLPFFRGLLKVAFEEFNQPSAFEIQAIYTATVDQQSLISWSSLVINIPKEVTPPRLSQIFKKDLIDNQLVREAFEEVIINQLPSTLEDPLTTSLYLKRYSRLPVVSSAFILSRILPKLPHKRDEIYRAEINLLGSKDKDIQRWCWSSLSWLVHAVRPLTIQELSTAVALHCIKSDISKNEIKNHISVKMLDDLDSHLGLFVRIEGQRLEIIHDTAKRFILSHSNSIIDKSLRLDNHADMVLLCLRYLEAIITNSNDPAAEDGEEYGFMYYSVENWPRHYYLALEDAQVDQARLDEHVLEFLFHHEIEAWVPWFDKYQTTASHLIAIETTEAYPFQIVCGLGQSRIIAHVLEEKARYSVNDEILCVSLDTAIKNGQSAVVPMLLQAGARSKLGLCYAAERNLVSVIDQLLTQEKEPGIFERAAMAAATQGCLQAIDILCNQFTNPNEMTRIKNKALELAVTGDHRSIVSALLQPRDIFRTTTPTPNVSGDLPPASGLEDVRSEEGVASEYKSALELAVAWGHTDIASLLIDAGAQVTQSVLDCASKQPNIKAVRLVVQALKIQNSIHTSSPGLHFASARGYTDVVKELLDSGVNIDYRDSSNQTPLHKAAERGHSDVVQLLLKRGADRNAFDNHGNMPCHLAAAKGHIAIHKALQEDPETRNDDLVVLQAAKGGHLLMVKYLLTLKLKTVSTNDQNTLNTALLEATSRGLRSIVRALCENGLDLKSRTGTASPLHNAASGGYADIVQDLMDQGAEINARDEAKRTPLHLSVSYLKVVVLLLGGGADPNPLDLDGRSPLHLAASLTQAEQAEEVAGILLANKAKPDLKDEKGVTPLLLAASNTHFNVVELLLKKGADPNVKDSSMKSPLHYAANLVEPAEAEKYVDMLLDHCLDLNIQDNAGNTPLHLAAARKHYKAVEMLLNKGAKPNLLNSAEKSPLHLVVQVGTRAAYGEEENIESCVRSFLRHHAEVNVQDKSKSTPLHWAAVYGRAGVVEALVKNGADVNGMGRYERTPLAEAAVGNHLEVAKVLLANGADIDHQGAIKKLTPLYRASQKGLPEMVSFLLDNGADHKIASTSGWTPLGTAADYCRTEVVKLLLERGADVNHKSNNGLTPLHVASRKGSEDVVEVLLKHNASTWSKSNLGNTARDLATKKRIIDMIDQARSSEPQTTVSDETVSTQYNFKEVELSAAGYSSMLAIDKVGRRSIIE